MADVKGGMTDFYESKKAEIAQANKLFVAQWPSVSREVIKGAGPKERKDIQVKWMMLHPSKCQDPVALLKSKVPLPPLVQAAKAAAVQTRGGQKRARGTVVRAASSSSHDEEESGSSDENTSSADDSESDDVSAACRRRGRQRQPAATVVPAPRAPKPKAPPREKFLPGWKGYGLEFWRDVPDAAATDARIGLQVLAPENIKLGMSCAIIPVWMSVPQNILVVTVIEVARRHPAVPEWTGVAEKLRGVSLQNFSKAYVIPSDMVAVDAAIGAWLSGAWFLNVAPS